MLYRIRLRQYLTIHCFLISKDHPPIHMQHTRQTEKHVFEKCPIYESTRTILNLSLDIIKIINGEQTSKNHQVHLKILLT